MKTKRIVLVFLVLLAAATMVFMLSGCQVVYPTRNGYAAAAILTNSRRIEVSRTGGSIEAANVSNPVGTALTGAAGLMMSGGVSGALP